MVSFALSSLLCVTLILAGKTGVPLIALLLYGCLDALAYSQWLQGKGQYIFTYSERSPLWLKWLPVIVLWRFRHSKFISKHVGFTWSKGE